MSQPEAKKAARDTEVFIGSVEHPVRFSYLRAHKPEQRVNETTKEKEGDPKYSSMVIVPKNGPWKELAEKAMRAAAVEFFGGNKKYESLDNVWRDGDDDKEEEKGDAVKGCWFFNCTTVNKPQVVGVERDDDGKLKRLDDTEIKSGDWGRIKVNFYGYDKRGKKGIAASMGNLQKLKDGDPLGFQSNADDDFDDTPL